MKVAVTVEQFWHPVPGGTARATHKTIRALQRAGGIELVGVAARHRSNHDNEGHEITIPVCHSRLPRPLLYEGWLRLGRPRSTNLVEKVDVVWASAMVTPARTAAAMVTTIHDLEFLDHPEWNTARGRSFFPRAFSVARNRSDLLVTPSQTVADRCIRAGVDPSKLRVVPWGVSTERVGADEVAEVINHYGLPERFVLWVGTVEPRKNLLGLAEAMKDIDAPLVVVGPDGWNADAEELLAPLGAGAFRLGQVPDRDLHSLYAAASVFAFPSFAEGFGLPVLEAMAQGTPVVTSAGTATEEAGGDAASLVDPHQSAAIAEAIRAILNSDSHAAQMKEQGLARAAEMTWDATAQGYAAAFASAMNQSK